jgi:hypothetical protein
MMDLSDVKRSMDRLLLNQHLQIIECASHVFISVSIFCLYFVAMFLLKTKNLRYKIAGKWQLTYFFMLSDFSFQYSISIPRINKVEMVVM